MGDPQPATSSPSNSFPYILPIAAPIGSKRADWHAMGPLVLSNHHFQDTSGMISVIWGLPLTIPEQGTVYISAQGAGSGGVADASVRG